MAGPARQEYDRERPWHRAAQRQGCGVQPAGDEPLLVGESSIADKTVGEDFEFELGEPASVQTDMVVVREKGRVTSFKITVTNSNPWPIEYEAGIQIADGAALRSPSDSLTKKDGNPLWIARVPANGSAKLTYDIREAKSKDD